MRVGRRFTSPYINRFLQPDTIIPYPANPQSWNRFAYTLNNPVRYNDPTGHNADCGMGDSVCQGGWWYIFYRGASGERTRSEKLSNGITNILSELDKKGIFTKTGDVDNFIGQVNRSKAEAHGRSTAVGIINGDITLDDLLETPIDMDGNIWLPENCTEEICAQANALEYLSDLGDPIGTKNKLCKDFWICTWASWTPAYEGYGVESQSRLPNNANVPVSMHTLGLAVDLNYMQNNELMEQSLVDSIIEIGENSGLCLPISNENWHFEACP